MDNIAISSHSGFLDQELSRAILMKTALEGKDFQTARREATQEGWDSRSANLREQSPTVHHGNNEVDYLLELQSVSMTVLEAEIQTSEGSLSLHAVRIETASVSLQSGKRPSAASVSAQLQTVRTEATRLSIASSGDSSHAPKDPLVITLGNDGPETTGEKGAQLFDLAGDGLIKPTSFVTGHSAFLALDRNGNGIIDNGLELFGDQHGASDGYAELAKFDANHDFQIDALDPVYSQLQLLHGSNRTTSLAQQGILSLSLKTIDEKSITAKGDAILGASIAMTRDGRALNTYALGLQQFEAVA